MRCRWIWLIYYEGITAMLEGSSGYSCILCILPTCFDELKFRLANSMPYGLEKTQVCSHKGWDGRWEGGAQTVYRLSSSDKGPDRLLCTVLR